MSSTINRRTFIEGVSAAAVGFTIVPSSVLGGKHLSPSDMINIAYIGCGTQGLRELPDLLSLEDVRVTAVCDPQKEARGYFDWSPNGLRDSLRKCINNPNWKPGGDGTIPGGLDTGKEIVDAFYQSRDGKSYQCRPYADFRELLDIHPDLDAVKVMATDHLHGVISAAAIKRGIHVTMHKPIANRLQEGFEVIEMAKNSDVTTHLIPWETNGSMKQVLAWIKGGVIGKLKEVHNWSNRPVWPQYAEIPKDKPQIPEGFDWDLWLGPEAERSYHPHYTNMVFRGWYDFGGGSMADMGHYSLWTVFKALELKNPFYIEPQLSHVCGLTEQRTAYQIHNDYSFPYASSCRFKYPANNWRGAVDLIWYDGGFRPPVPNAFYEKDQELPVEGMMFAGEKGIIMSSDFYLREPYVLEGDKKLARQIDDSKDNFEKASGERRFVDSIKSGTQTEGSFRNAWPITEAVNLYAAALRSGKNLKYNATSREITNSEEANKYLIREYRKGWSLDEV